MDDVQLHYVISKLRVLPKPRHLRVKKERLDSFLNTNISLGHLEISKRENIAERNFDSIMVELTPDLQLLLKHIYDNNQKGQDND